jgi:electron transfer flavoprotein alpha subunit
MRVKIDALQCTGCGTCTYLCPVGALVIDGTKCRVLDNCTSCGVCIDACNFKAIAPETIKKLKRIAKKHGN